MRTRERHEIKGISRKGLVFSLLLLVFALLAPRAVPAQDMMDRVAFFGGMKDRSIGSAGSEAAADYILKAFQNAGLEHVGTQVFLAPVPEVSSASVEAEGRTIPIYPWQANLVYLSVTPEEGLSGTLVYAGSGDFSKFDNAPVSGSIVLMDMDSGGNWLNAAGLGASAIIFIGDDHSIRGAYKEKSTQTPLAIPRYWVSRTDGEYLKSLAADGAPRVTVKSRTRWKNKVVQNCYGILPGKDPKLQKEIIVLNAAYDASSSVLGFAPGADESTSISALLSLAEDFSRDPPTRSVLFLATIGNGQSHDGLRQFVWYANSKKKTLKKAVSQLKEVKQKADDRLDLLEKPDPLNQDSPQDREIVLQALLEKAKDKADALTREIQYKKSLSMKEIQAAQEEPRKYRQLTMVTDLTRLTPEQRELALALVNEAIEDSHAAHKELKIRIQASKSGGEVRALMEGYTPALYLDLHLSSHFSKLGLVEVGDTYPLRASLQRANRAARLDALFNQVGDQTAAELGLPDICSDTSRGGSPEEGAGRAYGKSHPASDVANIAGLPAVSLMALDDQRPFWSTPLDTLERVDRESIRTLTRFLPITLRRLLSEPSLKSSIDSGIVASSGLEGQAMFIRQGELFPDQPAPGTIISVIQGDSVFRTMVTVEGSYFIPGLANKRVALEKIILESYGIDPATGRIGTALDKTKTGKENFRINVKGESATAALILFRCQQTDVIPVFNPQNMGYLTKADLLDASTEALPLRHWFSRVDGRNTMAISVFLEKGTRFKLIMSESLLARELFLLNGSKENPEGRGFLIADPPTISLVPYEVTNDLHNLVGQRLQNLVRHGINNVYLESLFRDSEKELEQAVIALSRHHYKDFWDRIVPAWAKLDIVYGEIESNQRDVLGGVMFFIALFVPFAFCIERYLFCFRNIYQQIVAFFLILIITILIIRALHPAFQLTYSPMVVIVAFFIVGLSLLVSSIIFLRFEGEMEDLHTRIAHVKTPQASKWQSFGAGFSIGVSNLNRRKLRTGLTCITLIILTFTVMSFTNVKSLHKSTLTRISEDNAYSGILLRHQFRLPLTMLTLQDMKTSFTEGEASIWPRAWIDPAMGTERIITAVFRAGQSSPVEGILGFGLNPPEYFRQLLTSGRWFEGSDDNSILLPAAMAKRLGLDPEADLNAVVLLFGTPFKIVGYFDGSLLDSVKDLDQNPLAPAYLEVGQGEDMSEVEIEAMQGGEELLPQTERFRYAAGNQTIILPFEKCLEYGGTLKAIAIQPRGNPVEIADSLSTWLAFPLFVGDNGTWYHSASTTLRYQGVANLLVPILIVIFITLNTMIGHVHERQREIGTYTSIGLAPTHVGFLFIVEALSMAVISTVIGYILAQLSAKYLGNVAAFSQLTFNYSSLASVACMFLVFSVVFLAALYPARLAARIAMPDVNRTWTLPASEGDSIFMNLPFLLKIEEESGIMRFLNAFFHSHMDVAHGIFIVDEISMDDEIPPARPGHVPFPFCIVIRTNTWLAPFDFGIKQRIQLHCCPSAEDPGYLEIAIVMTRVSGEHSAWMRANKNFIKAIRKQMLLWRLLDNEAKSVYFHPDEKPAVMP